jgi:hypothetical protein
LDTGVGGGGAASGAGVRLATKANPSTASVASIRMPVLPPLANGAMPSACHWRCCCSPGTSARAGSEAIATPLDSKTKSPAAFHRVPRRAGARAIALPVARPKDGAWLGFPLNTGPVMGNQG